jgi:hypothetical protein
VASPTMSYLICSVALILLILVMPFFFEIQRDSIADEMTRRELKEIADYTSNTLANLFFLANSTNSFNVNVTKELLYLPLTVDDSFYVLSIVSVGDEVSKVTAYLKDRSWIAGDSWIVPGLKALNENSLEIGSKTVVASCYSDSAVFYVSLGYGD